jgi:hypothetical protein
VSAILVARPAAPCLAGALTLLALFAPQWALAAEEDASRALIGGRLIWDASDELDLLGDVWADLPFADPWRPGVFLAADIRTAIDRAGSDFTFGVRDVEYDLDLGYRDPRGWFSGIPVSLFLGQRGKLAVDDIGDAWIRYAAVGLESRDFRRPGEPNAGSPVRFAWRVAGGPVVDERRVDANFVLRGEARLYPHALRVGRMGSFGLESRVDGLFDGGRFLGDLAVGPAFSLSVPGDRRAPFFAQYQRSRSPLGIGHSALLLGFEYSEGAHAGGARAHPPELRGLLGVGSGDSGRASGEFLLDVLSPSFLSGLRVAFALDANLLTGDDADELFYLYHLGLEKPTSAGAVGVYFYHRSNHVVDGDNVQGVTSINVVELALSSDGWNRPGRRECRGRRGSVDGRAAAGFLVDSSFGEDHRWHLRAGLRWGLPLAPRRVAPFLRGEAEVGDVERWSVAAGISPVERWDFALDYRSDDQFFGRDRRVFQLVARYGF